MFKYLLAFAVLIWAEWQVWFWASDYIGGLGVVCATLLAVYIGFKLIATGASGLSHLRQGGNQQAPLSASMAQSVAYIMVGILFILPGLISDVLGVLLLLPPVQLKLADRLGRSVIAKMSQAGQFAGAGGASGVFGAVFSAQSGTHEPDQVSDVLSSVFAKRHNNQSTIIEGQATEVTEAVEPIDVDKQISVQSTAVTQPSDGNSNNIDKH